MARVWTQEQKQVAAERMRAIQSKRWAEKKALEASAAIVTPEQPIVESGVDRLIQIGATIEALAEVDRGTSEAPYATVSRPRITQYLVRTNGAGDIVSELGPCVCGAVKRAWHKVCLGGSK